VLVTGSYALGVLELIFHTTIDYARCDGFFTFRQDQTAHAVCKAYYVAAIAACYVMNWSLV
jgi:hypothetical protein